MQIRDGPAAVRGVALRHEATERELGKAAEGEPRVRRPAGRPPYRSPRGRRNRGQTATRASSPSRWSCRRPRSQRPSTFASKARRARSSPRPRSPSPPGTRSTRSSRRRSLGELYYHLTQSSFGNYVDQVGRYGGTADSGWVFKVNDVSPPVGADKVVLKDGDHVLWYYATFGPTGGPPTLEVKASGEGLLHGGRLRRQRQGRGGDRPASGTSARRRRSPARSARRSAPGRTRACSCARPRPGAVRSNAVK